MSINDEIKDSISSSNLNEKLTAKSILENNEKHKEMMKENARIRK